MNIIYSDKSIPKQITKSIFLAGPSPRELNVHDWRIEAVEYLKKINFDGTLFIPIPENRFHGGNDNDSWTYTNQVDWECEARNVADIILFWIPRSISGKMPGFVTNVEFGEDLHSGKIVYGRPEKAEKCKYLDKRFQDLNLIVHNKLEDLINQALSILGEGSLRNDGEVYVPLFIWQTEEFQNWYSNLKQSGNSLIKATVLDFFKVNNENLFSFTLKVDIYIKKENRVKSNEFLFSRKNSSQVVVYYNDLENNEKHLVLVEEFRSSVNNSSGFVLEIPGGSSFDNEKDKKSIAASEVFEEIGLSIKDLNRFVFVNERQTLSSLSSHISTLFKLEITKDEFDFIINNIDNTFGNKEESEITKISIIKFSDLFNYNLDFSNIGMIYSAFLEN